MQRHLGVLAATAVALATAELYNGGVTRSYRYLKRCPGHASTDRTALHIQVHTHSICAVAYKVAHPVSSTSCTAQRMLTDKMAHPVTCPRQIPPTAVLGECRSLMLSIANWLEEQGGLPLYTVEGAYAMCSGTLLDTAAGSHLHFGHARLRE